MIRVGLGQDSHKLVKGKGALVLGGLKISDNYYLKADSDGDVVIHSLCNALSTAIGGGSLDTWAGEMNRKGVIESKEFLKVIFEKVKKLGYGVNNIAVMVEAKEPRLERHRDRMQKSLAELLGIEKEQVGMAFTSGESLTSFGRGEGIQALTVVLIEK